MDCSMPGLPVHHQLLELAQPHIYRVGDFIQPSHPLLSPSPPTFNLSQHLGLFKWVSSSYQVTKVLEFQLQHQYFQSDRHFFFLFCSLSFSPAPTGVPGTWLPLVTIHWKNAFNPYNFPVMWVLLLSLIFRWLPERLSNWPHVSWSKEE